MKHKVFLSIAMVICGMMTIFAQTNNKISYQAVVRDANNNLVANKPLTVQVTVSDGQTAYTETHSVQTNAKCVHQR